jgi:type II secretory pathway pseudopilin PulG
MIKPRTLRRIVLVGLTLVLLGVITEWFLSSLRYKAKVAQNLVALQEAADASRQYFAVFGEWPKSLNDLWKGNNPRRMAFLRGEFPIRDGESWDQEVVYVPFDATRGWGVARSHPIVGNGKELVQEVKFGP